MGDQGTQMLDTQSLIDSIQEEPFNNSNDMVPQAWARLFPINPVFKEYELKKDLVTFGRLECDVLLNANLPTLSSSAYSAVHFKIKREFHGKAGYTIFIEDWSSNGTFINGDKIGKGRIQALKNNCEISLAKKENKAYIFVNTSDKNDDSNYPIELRQKYTVTEKIGSGAYGEVRLAFEKFTRNKYAIKIIQKKRMTMNKNTGNKEILGEAEILKKLNHPCIIRIIEVFSNDFEVFMVLDFAEGGELFDKVVDLGQYDENTAKLLFYQMVVAINYLHANNISHRDLKPENILLNSHDKKETLIKITDFGLSKFFDNNPVMKTFCGTQNYLAPEVLKGDGKYTNKIDNWSLGVILYIMLSGQPPFNDDELDIQIKRGQYHFADPCWNRISSQAKDVVKKLMCVDVNKRASLDEILNHDWIKKDIQMKEKAKALMYPAENKRELDFAGNEQSETKRLKPSDSYMTDNSE